MISATAANTPCHDAAANAHKDKETLFDAETLMGTSGPLSEEKDALQIQSLRQQDGRCVERREQRNSRERLHFDLESPP